MAAWRMPDLEPGSVRAFIDDHCAGCLAPLPFDVQGLFCSAICKEVAKDVRYARGVYRDGRVRHPDVKYALSIRMAHLHASGYDTIARKVPAVVRAQISERDGGLCVVCGASGEEIDHIDGDSYDLDNLQLLCKKCHRAKTARSLEPASAEQRAAVAVLLERRVHPVVPLLLADDEIQWRGVEPSLRSARRRRLEDEATDYGIDLGRPRRPWHEVADEYWEMMTPDSEVATEDDDSGYGPDSYFSRAMERDD